MPRRIGRVASCWLAVALGLPGLASIGADDPGNPPRDERMAAIVTAVRAEEAKYRDLEYSARIIGCATGQQGQQDPAGFSLFATRRVVFQGDRVSFHQRAFERRGEVKSHHEEASAYDGERTRTVASGNCANIHLGRWLHPAALAPHSLALEAIGINIPLSTYLAGTEAVHAHLGYGSDLVLPRFSLPFGTVEARLEGEEKLDGLHCLRIQVDQRPVLTDVPITRRLWLAPERNYLCIREESPGCTMHVDELRQVAPGLWFPARITVTVAPTGRRMRPASTTRTVTVFEKIDLAPRHEPPFFRDVVIPADLPVFTIRDRRLVGSELPEPVGGDRGPHALRELAPRVAAQERRYGNLDVSARDQGYRLWRTVSGSRLVFDRMYEQRSITQGNLFSLASWYSNAIPDAVRVVRSDVTSFDGRWIRHASSSTTGDRATSMASLRRAIIEDPSRVAPHLLLIRPHTMLLGSQGFSTPLSDLVRLPRPFLPQGLAFHYCGTATVDGHPCITLRSDAGGSPIMSRDQSYVLHLATDRNHIPIRMEHFLCPRFERPIAVAIGRCDDLREIAPGLWYPFHVEEMTLDPVSFLNQGWVVVQTRRVVTVDSAASFARVDESVFSDVTVPEETSVHVLDGTGGLVGSMVQAEEGPLAIDARTYAKMILTRKPAQVNIRMPQPRRKGPADHVGEPVPAFPAGMTWIGSDPPVWPTLWGRFVVLVFWSEWDDDGRDDMKRLTRFVREHPQNGPAVIGIHPPGSSPIEIRRAIDAQHLEFPTGVDVEPPADSAAVGELFGRLEVTSVPYLIVIDGEGKIADAGEVGAVLTRLEARLDRDR